ncbi:MAG: hypothetical protein AAGJ18_04565 [Bacteroidota bacterium]
MEKVYVLDGNKMQTKNALYKEVERRLTYGFNWKIGRNLDAFNYVPYDKVFKIRK